VNDARVELAKAGLSNDEVVMLKGVAAYAVEGMVWGRPISNQVDFLGMASIPRLLDKRLIRVVAQFEAGHPAYSITPIGREVIKMIKTGLPRLKANNPGGPQVA
jgi:hypothetical protein